MSIPGSASPAATELLAAENTQLPITAFSRLGKTGLLTSRIGFGTYRCHQDNEEHREALRSALHGGCNLIDTSSNYTDGSAEALIGEILNEEIVWNGRPREAFVVVSKAGYIQGENYRIAVERQDQGNPFPEVVQYQPNLWHCIHPEFLEDQITRSLARMHLDTLDVYLLHNPEYFLMSAHQAATSPSAEVRNQFYDRLRRAFICLEKMVDDGLIRHYGISSNGFPLPANAPDFVDLGRCWQAFQDACLQSGKSVQEGHFAVIQLPMNWFENSAAIHANNTWDQRPLTIMELAEKLDIAVLTNRPLNAFRRNRLVRLANYGFDPDINYNARLEHSLQLLNLQEESLRSWVQDTFTASAGLLKQTQMLFNASAQLQQLAGQFYDISRLKGILQQFQSFFNSAIETALKKIPEPEKPHAVTHLNAYQTGFSNVCQALIDREDSRNFEQTRHLDALFNQEVPALKAIANFAQKAIKVLIETPGVTSVLCGMRKRDYVIACLEVLKSEKTIDGRGLLEWSRSSDTGQESE